MGRCGRRRESPPPRFAVVVRGIAVRTSFRRGAVGRDGDEAHICTADDGEAGEGCEEHITRKYKIAVGDIGSGKSSQ